MIYISGATGAKTGGTMKLLGKGHDPLFWQDVREKEVFRAYREELHKFWEEHAKDFEIKALSYSKWKLFWDTGDRGEYERDYFDRRYCVEHTAILALIYPEEKKYIDKLMELIFAICDEYTWCLPAHQGQNEKNDNSRLDLFATEMGFYLSIIYTLLGDRLDPVIKDRIRVEIDRRIVTTLLSCENYGWWETGTTNWTAVCVGSIGGTLMLMRPELMDEKMTKRLTTAMDGFLKGFADDGICTEGCGYWAYGVSFFVQFADMLKTFTGGKIDYFKNPKMKAIASFPHKMFLSGKAAVSFADGGRELEYTFGVMHRLKQEYPDDVLIYSPEYGSFDIGCGRLSIRLFGAIWLNEEFYLNPADSTASFESYAENAQWLTKRTPSYGFAAKGGHNKEMHNHNDVGSFIFAKGGRQLLVDTGAGRYTRQYFSPVRYDIFEPSSRSHSVPVVNGEYQVVGAEYSACDIEYRAGMFTMDIAGAYPKSGVTSIRRTFTMTNDTVKLVDEYVMGEGDVVVERFVTPVEPRLISADTLEIGSATVRFDPDSADLHINTEMGTTGNNAIYYLIDFAVKPGVKKFGIEMK